jgi:hypothetical protein
MRVVSTSPNWGTFSSSASNVIAIFFAAAFFRQVTGQTNLPMAKNGRRSLCHGGARINY